MHRRDDHVPILMSEGGTVTRIYYHPDDGTYRCTAPPEYGGPRRAVWPHDNQNHGRGAAVARAVAVWTAAIVVNVLLGVALSMAWWLVVRTGG